MSYLVLARKYRPQTFDEVYAQDHITKILKNSIEMDRIAQAYLFTGTRGVGKTSMARILAKSLNCLEDESIHPCNKCQNCKEITNGNSSDVIEIDGASNTGVDDIRELQKELMYSATHSRYKIYIIDEVHMLSKNAFNALLKTLEEPPERVIFIFATTEPHKVLPTIISRCQRFDFKRIPINAIIDRLRLICKKEKIVIETEALFTIAQKADGSLRDAESLLDQVTAYKETNIKLKDVLQIFGLIGNEVYNKIVEAILQKDSKKIINNLHTILEKGSDLQEFISGLLDYFRKLLLLKIGIDVQDITKNQKVIMQEFAKKFEENKLLYLMSILIKCKTEIKNSNSPTLVAEMTFIKLTKLTEMKSIEKIIENLPKSSNSINVSYNKQTETSKNIKLHNKTKLEKEKLNKEIENDKPKIKKLTREIFKENQESIIKKLSNSIVANRLNKSKLEKIEDNVVYFKIPQGLGEELIRDEKENIEKVISNHFDINVSVRFIVDKDSKNNDLILNPTMQDIKKHTPKIAKFIEITDSELL